MIGYIWHGVGGGIYRIELCWDIEEREYVGICWDLCFGCADRSCIALGEDLGLALCRLFAVWDPVGSGRGSYDLNTVRALIGMGIGEVRRIHPTEYRLRVGVGFEE